jgi:hypothetical protein
MSLRPAMEYLGYALRLDEDAFLAKFGPTWLLIEPFEASDEETRVNTAAGGAVIPTEHSLSPVRKRAGANAFPTMITVGRAPNNDLFIPAPEVSTFHAFFSLTPTGVNLTDGSSTYGSWVDGVRLQPRVSVDMTYGQKVNFASVRGTLMSAAQVHRMLQTPGSLA